MSNMRLCPFLVLHLGMAHGLTKPPAEVDCAIHQMAFDFAAELLVGRSVDGPGLAEVAAGLGLEKPEGKFFLSRCCCEAAARVPRKWHVMRMWCNWK
jgi:hypothetical protein